MLPPHLGSESRRTDSSSCAFGGWASRVDDLKVTYVGVEESAGSVTVSSVDAVLPKL
jgi:peroxiredoxin